MGELVVVETDQAVATIRLNRPPMNALSAGLQSDLADAVARVSADETVRAVVLYGGEKLFAAGADIKEMSQASYAEMTRISSNLQAALNAVAAIGKPVIAAVTGYALGGGLELALCADFRVLGEGARVGQPEILLGLIPGAGGTQRLPRLIGPARAKDLIFSGRFVSAAEALSIGLADRVVPDAQVYQAACELAARLCRRAVRSRWRPPSRPSISAWTPTWRPAWSSSGSASPACSRPRMPGAGCAASWRMGRGRPRSAAAEPGGRRQGGLAAA